MAESAAYQQAMNKAASAAWDHDWDMALAAYQKAFEASPDDPQALAGLALSFLELGRYTEALLTYDRITKIVSSDPLPREKMAEIFQRTGRPTSAARQFLAAGEIYLARKDMMRAIPNWEQAVQLDPELAQARMRLATAYERARQTHQQAVTEYVHVARLLQQAGQTQRAAQALQRALALDPISGEARDALADLKRNRPIQINEAALRPQTSTTSTQPAAITEDDLTGEESDLLKASEQTQTYTPSEEGVRRAMGALADSIWNGEAPSKAQQPLLDALDAQQLGEMDEALRHYQAAEQAGFASPALDFIKGALYQQVGRSEEAVQALSRLGDSSDYGLISGLLAGQAYLSSGNMQQAAASLLRALRAADREYNPGEVDVAGYESAIEGLENQADGYLKELAASVAGYLNAPTLPEKLSKALKNFAGRGMTSYFNNLLELIVEGGRPELAAIMGRVNAYMARDLVHMAREEAHFAISRAPDYLPAHQRLADILIYEGRTQEAVTKINLIANLYMMRNNPDKAIDLFLQSIDLWPTDATARRRVLDLMRRQNRFDEALHQYTELADMYHRLWADPQKAMEIYGEALNYARQEGGENGNVVPILKAMADIESQRLNWRRALGYYERAVELKPDDDALKLAMIDLYFQTGEDAAAIRMLDNVMRQLVQSGEAQRVAPMLEAQVRSHPEQIPLVQRLAEVYRQQGRTQEALAQLDKLGDLQIDAGRVQDAAETVRRIIELNPPDVDDYRMLLAQLQGGEG